MSRRNILRISSLTLILLNVGILLFSLKGNPNSCIAFAVPYLWAWIQIIAQQEPTVWEKFYLVAVLHVVLLFLGWIPVMMFQYLHADGLVFFASSFVAVTIALIAMRLARWVSLLVIVPLFVGSCFVLGSMEVDLAGYVFVFCMLFCGYGVVNTEAKVVDSR